MIDFRQIPVKNKKRKVPLETQDNKKEVVFCIKRKKGEQPADLFGLQDEEFVKKLYETRKVQRLDLDWLSKKMESHLTIDEAVNHKQHFVLQRIDPIRSLIENKREQFHHKERKEKTDELFKMKRREFLNNKIIFKIEDKEDQLICNDTPCLIQSFAEYAAQQYEDEDEDEVEFYALTQTTDLKKGKCVAISKQTIDSVANQKLFEEEQGFNSREDDIEEEDDSEDSNREDNPNYDYPSDDGEEFDSQEDYPEEQEVEYDEDVEQVEQDCEDGYEGGPIRKEQRQIEEDEESDNEEQGLVRSDKDFFKFLSQHNLYEKSKREVVTFEYDKHF